MPPARSSLIRRRRSSLAMGLTQVKPGNYGINPSISPRALTFAPNVTPGTYVEADDDLKDESAPPSPSTALFPPTEPPSAPTRRRLPPGKRLSQGYIPRPPNAFMLFRANFVRQKHVPGSIETNHGSLSKIIGNCWRALPLEEKKYWEHEAKKAKAAHRERYPHYRFRPVHNKAKKAAASAVAGVLVPTDKRKDKLPSQPADEERCEVVAALLLEGKKGEELAEAMREIELARAISRPESAGSQHTYQLPAQAPVPLYMQRRPSSVPPPSMLYNPAHPIALPTLPFLVAPTPQAAYSANAMFNNNAYTMGFSSVHGSRAPSPVGNIARTRTYLSMRRASSCQPIPSERMWDGYDPHSMVYAPPMPTRWELQPDWSPLPEVTDASIFQPGWTSSFKDSTAELSPFEPNMNMQTYAPHDHPLHLNLNIGPLDNFDFASAPSTATEAYSAVTPGTILEPLEPHATWPVPESCPSSAFSGSPARSDASLPTTSTIMQTSASLPPVDSQSQVLRAPQPQHPRISFDAWPQDVVDKMQMAHGDGDEQLALGLGIDGGYVGQYHSYADVGMCGVEMDMGMDATGYAYCPPQEF